MKNLIPFFALIITLFLGFSACTTRYYIVRHAEKDTSVADVPGPDGQALTPAGRLRAKALWDSVKNKGVRQIFASQYLRTQLTAAPTAIALGISVTPYDRNADIQILVNHLRSIGDHSALIVGHSDTVPALIHALLGNNNEVITINDDDYDNFFIVKRYKGLGPVTYTLERRGTYGAVSPTP